MKKFLLFSFLTALLSASSIPQTFAAAKNAPRERIAVAEPRATGGVSEKSLAGVSDYLESKLGGTYDLYSRAALKAMLKESAFVNSGMVLDDETRQQLAQKSVNCLLVYSISQLGSRLSLTMMVVDCATGQVRKGQRAAVTARSLDELFGRLDLALAKMGLLAGAEEPAVKRLAVLPVGTTAGVPQQLGDDLHGKLSSFLLKSGVFELVSREDLERIARENNLADSSLSDPGQLAKIGQLKLADYLAIVKISRYDHYLVGGGTAIAGAVAPRSQLAIQMELRIVEVATGKIVAVESLRDSMKSTDIPAASRRDWVPADYDHAFLEHASGVLGNALLNRLDPILVAAVDGGSIYLSRGSGAGVYLGEYFNVFNPGRQVVHPKTKRVLGTTENYAATIQVVQVTPDLSIAAVAGQPAEAIREGAVCRTAEPTAESTPYGVAPAPPPPPPAYPMAN